MMGKCHNFEYSIVETEDGYAIHIKGDKEKLKAKFEAMEAYKNYREKAKAAGFGFHGFKDKFFGHLHSHLQAMHKHHKDCSSNKAACCSDVSQADVETKESNN